MTSVKEAAVAGLLVAAILLGTGAGYLLSKPSQAGATITKTSAITTETTSSVTITTQTITFVTSPTNSSQACVSNLANPPQTQYISILHQIITMPSFVQFSNGRCWTYEGTFVASGPGYSSLNFVFDHFTDKIYYLCGALPAYEIDARVYVVPSLSNGSVTGISIEPEPVPPTICPPIASSIQPVWLNLVSWNSSGQTVSLKLQWFPFGNASLRSLQARISNSTWSYLIPFQQVNSTNLLQPGSSVVQEVFLAGAPLKGDVIYDMTATGTYVNGTQIVSSFRVQLQT